MTTTLGAKVSPSLLSVPAYANIHFGFFRLERGEEEMEEYDIRLLSTRRHQNAPPISPSKIRINPLIPGFFHWSP